MPPHLACLLTSHASSPRMRGLSLTAHAQALLEQIPQAAPLSPPAAPPTPQADDLRPIGACAQFCCVLCV
eukprot:943412-Rhodomonas_salina.1